MWNRQERVKGFEDSRSVLKDKKVVIIGVGGLGSHSAEYVVRMGVGNIVLIDDDVVEESNLARQGTYGMDDVGKYKVEVLGKALTNMVTDVNIEVYREKFIGQDLVENVDLILDGTDNAQVRYRIDEYSRKHDIPWIYASAVQTRASVIPFVPGETPCLSCVWGEEGESIDQSCDVRGVILPALTWAVSTQVMEGIKLLLGYDVIKEEVQYNVWNREEFTVPMEVYGKCECVKKEEKDIHRYRTCEPDVYRMVVKQNKYKEWIRKMESSEGYRKRIDTDKIQEFKKDEDSRVVFFLNGVVNVYGEEVYDFLMEVRNKEGVKK